MQEMQILSPQDLGTQRYNNIYHIARHRAECLIMHYLPVSEVGTIITQVLLMRSLNSLGEKLSCESDWWCCDPAPESWSLITLCWGGVYDKPKHKSVKSHICKYTPCDIQLDSETSLVVMAGSSVYAKSNCRCVFCSGRTPLISPHDPFQPHLS